MAEAEGRFWVQNGGTFVVFVEGQQWSEDEVGLLVNQIKSNGNLEEIRLAFGDETTRENCEIVGLPVVQTFVDLESKARFSVSINWGNNAIVPFLSNENTKKAISTLVLRESSFDIQPQLVSALENLPEIQVLKVHERPSTQFWSKLAQTNLSNKLWSVTIHNVGGPEQAREVVGFLQKNQQVYDLGLLAAGVEATQVLASYLGSGNCRVTELLWWFSDVFTSHSSFSPMANDPNPSNFRRIAEETMLLSALAANTRIKTLALCGCDYKASRLLVDSFLATKRPGLKNLCLSDIFFDFVGVDQDTLSLLLNSLLVENKSKVKSVVLSMHYLPAVQFGQALAAVLPKLSPHLEELAIRGTYNVVPAQHSSEYLESERGKVKKQIVAAMKRGQTISAPRPRGREPSNHLDSAFSLRAFEVINHMGLGPENADILQHCRAFALKQTICRDALNIGLEGKLPLATLPKALQAIAGHPVIEFVDSQQRDEESNNSGSEGIEGMEAADEGNPKFVSAKASYSATLLFYALRNNMFPRGNHKQETCTTVFDSLATCFRRRVAEEQQSRKRQRESDTLLLDRE